MRTRAPPSIVSGPTPPPRRRSTRLRGSVSAMRCGTRKTPAGLARRLERRTVRCGPKALTAVSTVSIGGEDGRSEEGHDSTGREARGREHDGGEEDDRQEDDREEGAGQEGHGRQGHRGEEDDRQE